MLKEIRHIRKLNFILSPQVHSVSGAKAPELNKANPTVPFPLVGARNLSSVFKTTESVLRCPLGALCLTQML